MMGGDQLAGDIFLNPTSRFRSAPQEPAEFLNEDEAFFALAMEDGRTALVAKSEVESVQPAAGECAPGGEPGDEPGAGQPQPFAVEVTLRSGTVVSCTMSIDAPPSRARLLDYLNSNHERFICVTDAGRLILVNRQAISHVHEQS